MHAISLADLALTRTLAWAADSLNPRLRIQAELERLHREISLLREEIRIKDARMEEIEPHRRPYYPPPARLAILELRQAGGLLRCGGPWPTHWRTAPKASFLGMSGNPAGGPPLVDAICLSSRLRERHRPHRPELIP